MEKNTLHKKKDEQFLSRHFEIQLKAMTSLVRLKILKVVSEEPRSVREISEAIGLSQPSVSSQMNILWTAGFLSKYKRGKHVYYELDRDSIRDVQDTILNYLDIK